MRHRRRTRKGRYSPRPTATAPVPYRAAAARRRGSAEVDPVVEDVVHRLGDGGIVVHLEPPGSDPGAEPLDDRFGLCLPSSAIADPGLGIGGKQMGVVEEANEADQDERARLVWRARRKHAGGRRPGNLVRHATTRHGGDDGSLLGYRSCRELLVENLALRPLGPAALVRAGDLPRRRTRARGPRPTNEAPDPGCDRRALLPAFAAPGRAACPSRSSSRGIGRPRSNASNQTP